MMRWDRSSLAGIWITVGIIFRTTTLSSTHVFYNVTCGSDTMMITLNVTNYPSTAVYLQNLKGYPGCSPHVETGLLLFTLNLNNTVHCGVSKMLNKVTGHSIYYHRVVIEIPKKTKEVLFVQCVIPGDFNMDFVRLDWQRESLQVNYTTESSVPEMMPSSNWSNEVIPYLNMVIRDKGKRLDTSVLVHPGSLLDLLVYLEKESTGKYGLSLRYITMTDDTRSQEEVIVMNGCSVDPYVIQLFSPTDGILKSKFRAFKFQKSEFVIFLATVNVCLQQCIEVDCYGEPDKSGRRKREIPRYLPHYNNEVYEVEISAFLRLKSVEGDIIVEESTNETLDTIYEDYEVDTSPSSASRLFLHLFPVFIDLFLTTMIIIIIS